MGQKMTWEEMKKAYPDEWVVVVDYNRTGPVEVEGMVVAHAPKKAEINPTPRNIIQKYCRIAVRYTGELVQDSDLPLLWQISATA